MEGYTRTGRGDNARVLIYSHDTFGLGHLRRCRAIAHHLVEKNKDITVLILTGSSIIGNFDFRSRVDFVRVPGVIKLRNGDYTPLQLHIDIEDTLALRESIIRHTASMFDPDLFIVDKEPLGLRGEVEETLHVMRDRGVPTVLGLRDVMDDPDLLEPEWERKNVMPALQDLFDAIWVYGLPQIHDPLAGIRVPDSVRRKMTYTGYLRREVSTDGNLSQPAKIRGPYILVTPGGGGDGEMMVDWVIRAYETDRQQPYPALIVLGPFMPSDTQSQFIERATGLDDVEVITFDAHMESLMSEAVGVVAMGGYNTFCEIMSFDKRALIVPRTVPRREQFIRAQRFQELNLVSMLSDGEQVDTAAMITALRHLPQQPKPSEVVVPGLMDGLENVDRLARRWIERPRRALTLAEKRA
ncbi:MAG: glycosyltransferase [Alphaproteobacteria bacterium]|nr:glycosyltransferase [Alphaproteobacteria bacterium]